MYLKPGRKKSWNMVKSRNSLTTNTVQNSRDSSKPIFRFAGKR